MRNEKGIALVYLIILIVILFGILIGSIVYVLTAQNNASTENVEKNNTKINSDIDNETVDCFSEDEDNPGDLVDNISNYSLEIDTKNLSNNDFNSWNGTYFNSDYTLTLYRCGINSIYVSISKNESNDIEDIVLYIDDTNNLKNEILYTDDHKSIKIYKTSNGLKFSSESPDSESILNEIGKNELEFEKDEINDYGWDGVYTKDDTYIILAQASNSYLNIYIGKEFSAYNYTISDFDNNKIEYNNESLENKEQLIISKDDKKIIITASSIDINSMLNEISGTYEMK